MKTTRYYSVLFLIFSNFTSIVHSTTSTLIGKTPATSTITGKTPATTSPTLAKVTTSTAIANENRSRYKIFGKIELINTEGMVDYEIFRIGNERKLDEFIGRLDFPSVALQHGQKMYMAAIEYGNVVAFEKLIMKKINPYKHDPDFCMSAMEFFKSKFTSLSADQFIEMCEDPDIPFINHKKMMGMVFKSDMTLSESDFELQQSKEALQLQGYMKLKYQFRNSTFTIFKLSFNNNESAHK